MYSISLFFPNLISFKELFSILFQNFHIILNHTCHPSIIDIEIYVKNGRFKKFETFFFNLFSFYLNLFLILTNI
ncbi:hypothetical protein DSC47_19875 [Elizabethkingia miricola]|nr:hypothetical protein AYC65_16380 [Elizabethkingia bruuniana]ATL44671.1 hypothetical protein CQS02_15820 [Elizabethkingia miricola]KGO10055.1 hypothetical protein KS04_11325 [Elizabethkingia miricola]KUY27314.1 hypothetical protein ATB97_19010 [Elizabethkingia bruuniana]OPB60987.1 hypothetical protein BAY12_14505 [Elizabethkingia bruuniana]